MAGSIWKDYFTFSRKERTGVFVLLGLIAIIYVVPQFFPDDQTVKLYYNRDSLQQAGAKVSSHEFLPDRAENTESINHIVTTTAAAKFPFDPNTLDESGWIKLGVHPKTTKTILNFRLKGGKFRKPEDLRKIYGLRTEVADQLIPWIRIHTERTAFEKKASYPADDLKEARLLPHSDTTHGMKTIKPPKAFKSMPIDINLADSTSWEGLPAIGSKLASRIVLFRERLGGFYKVHQVGETFGISDSAFKVIIPYLYYSEVPLKMIKINSITAPELARHPYVRWNLAQAIINYRNQHGPFRNLNELQSISVLTPDLLEKLLPYLSID